MGGYKASVIDSTTNRRQRRCRSANLCFAIRLRPLTCTGWQRDKPRRVSGEAEGSANTGLVLQVDVAPAELATEADLVLAVYPGCGVRNMAGVVLTAERLSRTCAVKAGEADGRSAEERRGGDAGVQPQSRHIEAMVQVIECLVEDADGHQQLVGKVVGSCPVVRQRKALRDVRSNLEVRVCGTSGLRLAASPDEGLQAHGLLGRDCVVEVAYKVVAVTMPLVGFDIVAGVCD